MKYYLSFAIIGLLTINLSSFGQKQAHICQVKIVRLKFDKTLKINSQDINDSLLTQAKPMNSILVYNSEIRKFEIKTDSACCIYARQMFITSHGYLLTKDAVSRLSALQIALCCGIPIAVYVDNKEIYRAKLWNTISSFGNKSLTMTLVQDTLNVVSQLPNVPDFRNNILAKKNS